MEEEEDGGGRGGDKSFKGSFGKKKTIKTVHKAACEVTGPGIGSVPAEVPPAWLLLIVDG